MGDQRASKSGIPTLYGAIGAVVRKVGCLEMFPGVLGHALGHVVLHCELGGGEQPRDPELENTVTLFRCRYRFRCRSTE